MAEQPVIQNDQGAILTIGLVINSDRVAVVEPYGLSGISGGAVELCFDLVASWRSAAATLFVNCVSSDGYISFIAAEGMQDGKVPYRADFDPSIYPGTAAAGATPNNVSGLIVYYQDPADVVAGHRIRVAKTFMPGIPSGNLVGDQIDSTQQASYNDYATIVQPGFDSTGFPSGKWYRMLATPKPRATTQQIMRTVNTITRGYVVTQKRRLIPRL
jgi:hypothetical protein